MQWCLIEDHTIETILKSPPPCNYIHTSATFSIKMMAVVDAPSNGEARHEEMKVKLCRSVDLSDRSCPLPRGQKAGSQISGEFRFVQNKNDGLQCCTYIHIAYVHESQ